MATTQPEPTSPRARAIAAAQDRIKLITTLSDALAADAAHSDKVRDARECVLGLRAYLQKLNGAGKAMPKAPRGMAPTQPMAGVTVRRQTVAP